jgi:hypothetical protein
VNYQLVDGELVIQTERVSRLAGATHETVVAFEVDHVEADGAVGWSVAITGLANEVTDQDVIAKLRRLPFTRWVRGKDDRYVSISLDLMAGRRLRSLDAVTGDRDPAAPTLTQPR